MKLGFQVGILAAVGILLYLAIIAAAPYLVGVAVFFIIWFVCKDASKREERRAVEKPPDL